MSKNQFESLHMKLKYVIIGKSHFLSKHRDRMLEENKFCARAAETHGV